MSLNETKVTQPAPPIQTGGEPRIGQQIIVLGLLPGEDKRDFDLLQSILDENFNPRGALQKQIVSNIAMLMWRRDHLSVFRRSREVFVKYGSSLENSHPLLRQIGVALVCADRLQSTLQDKLDGSPDPMAGVLGANRQLMENAKAAFGPTVFDHIGEDDTFYDELQFATVARHVTPEKLTEELDLVARIDADIFANARRLEFLQAADERRSSAKTRRFPGQIRGRP